MAKNTTRRSPAAKLDTHCTTKAEEGYKALLTLRKIIKGKKATTQKDKAIYIKKYMKDCKGMYVEKDGKMVPTCDKFATKVVNMTRKIMKGLKIKKNITSKHTAKITKEAMADCKKKYPVL